MGSESYNHTGGWQTFKVPEGVYTLDVVLKGGGTSSSSGGYVSGAMSVTPGHVMWLMVGRQGKFHSNRQNGEGCFGGGGPGGVGRGNDNGGDGGGGATAIRQGSADGWIRCVAGGAGGQAGDGADGGHGGADTGDSGHRGPGGTGTVNATGGTQTGPGHGGTSNGRPGLAGENGTAGALGEGGRGGQASDGNSHGGGGGGGGFRAGGGGNAGRSGVAAAGGGGGGSNYTGNLYNAISRRGDGSSGNGSIELVWVDAPPKDTPPPPPSDVTVNDYPLEADTTTKSTGTVVIKGILSNPQREFTQMMVQLVAQDDNNQTNEWEFGWYTTYFSQTVGNVADGGDGIEVSVTINGLASNTKYYVRCYSVDSNGNWSGGVNDQGVWVGQYAAGSFWTNRPPKPPDLLSPSENNQFEVTDNIFFSWQFEEDDEDEVQAAYVLEYREKVIPGRPQPDWSVLSQATTVATGVNIDAGTFKGNRFYEWRVRVMDGQGSWSLNSLANSFYVIAVTTPPVLEWPRRGDAVVAATGNVFRWTFLDPSTGQTQNTADIRFRVVDTVDWITNYGTPVMPGAVSQWVFSAETFIQGYHYEWQVRTKDSTLLYSDWSASEHFWAVARPGSDMLVDISPQNQAVQPPLGCGVNRVFVFDRGGQVMRGEITGVSQLTYHRKRDDITKATIFVDQYDKDCGALLAELRSWMYEIVIFRDGKRVWEGPITRISSQPGVVEIDAGDVLSYLYRRIMRQGYNDAYREVNGQKLGGLSVTKRAGTLTMNALAYDDPNVLQWLTVISHSDDALQHRSVTDYSKTVWEEIDDLAAHAGLDYTAIGRRIVYWDTHRALGRLPEMRDADFSEPPTVTEYGMQLANHFGVTSNAGVYGVAERGMVYPDALPGTDPGIPIDEPSWVDRGRPLYYGWVEQLVSAYGETETDDEQVLTESAKASLQQTLHEQAERGIAARWPTPLVVRVPDNAQINPTVNIGFDQLVPGVFIPIRARGTIREVTQWQKLDSVTVQQTADSGEKISIVMSPAPNNGEDPDDAGGIEE